MKCFAKNSYNGTSYTEPDALSTACASYLMDHKIVVLAEHRDDAVPIPIAEWYDGHRIGMSAIANGCIKKRLQTIPPVTYSYRRGDIKAFQTSNNRGDSSDDDSRREQGGAGSGANTPNISFTTYYTS